MKRGKIKIRHNKKILMVIIFILIITIGLAFLIPKQEEIEEGACKKDKDCVKQQVTCCSCNMGGKEECMLGSEAREMQEKLNRECEKDILCIALYACQDTECKCEEGECIEVEK